MPLLRGRVACAAALAGLLLTGCTAQEPAPRTQPARDVSDTTSPSPTPTPAPTSSPTPTTEPVAPPEPPAELERTDEVGAAAAAEYFVSLYGYTLQTGDFTAWDRLSLADCQFCLGVREDVLAATAAGHKLTGGDITLHDVAVLPRDELIGGFPVHAHFTQSPELRLDSEGAVVAQTGADEGSVRVDTLHTREGWRILAVVVGDQ